MSADSRLHALLVECAAREGFPVAGGVDLALAEDMGAHVARYDEWLGRGFAGEMAYLVRGRDRRADPRLVFPDARSVFCVVSPYDRRPAGAGDPNQGPRYARYLRRQDYHKDIAERLERAMTSASAQRVAQGQAPLGWKVCVDTSAVLERSWAMLAGLGWLGKNTMLIHPKLGSYHFIGAVLLDTETGRGPAPLPDLCGHCDRCLTACPTGALEAPRSLDATRCISYWTLEKRGALPLTEKQRLAVGPWVAGCDLCQEACPFNLKPAREDSSREALTAGDEQAIALKEWEALLEETEEQYRERVRHSSLSRVKPAQFRRNLAIALANSLQGGNAETRCELRGRLEKRIRAKIAAETDPDAIREWSRLREVLDSANIAPVLNS